MTLSRPPTWTVAASGSPMTQGQLSNAIRRALNILDGWNDTTGVVTKNTGYYYELQGVIEDAVRCGAQAASGVHEVLPSEE